MNRLLSAYAFLLYLFLYLPLLILTIFSFNASPVAMFRGFSWRWYEQLFHDRALLDATINSLIVAIFATFIATIIGTAAAYGLWKVSAPIFTGGLYLSLVTPEVVTGVSLLVFFQAAFRLLPIQLGLHTVILAHVAFSLVFVVAVVLARLRTFDIALEEAGADLGGSEWQVFRYVTLPQLLPGILAAALLCFTVSFDDYVITSMVAGVDSETLPMVIYAMARKGVSPEINALSVLITLALGIFVLLAGRFERA